jgi:hypothetical protein
MPLEIVKQPYLDQLRAEVALLKRVLEGEPDQVAVARAWASVGKIQEALRELCPNHPHICSTTSDRRTPSKLRSHCLPDRLRALGLSASAVEPSATPCRLLRHPIFETLTPPTTLSWARNIPASRRAR